MTVDHPSHYRADTGFEAIDVIEAWGLGFCLGNAVKYIARAGRKEGASRDEDLRKAVWYIEREVGKGAEAEAVSGFKAKPVGDEIYVYDDDGQPVWMMSRSRASRMADTIRWASGHGDGEEKAIFIDGPSASLRDGKLALRWGIGPAYAMTLDNAQELMEQIGRILEALP